MIWQVPETMAAESPAKPRVSDNEWSVNYAYGVGYIISRAVFAFGHTCSPRPHYTIHAASRVLPHQAQEVGAGLSQRRGGEAHAADGGQQFGRLPIDNRRLLRQGGQFRSLGWRPELMQATGDGRFQSQHDVRGGTAARTFGGNQ